MSSTHPPWRRQCGTMVVHELLSELDPGYRANQRAADRDVHEIVRSGRAEEIVRKLITIPVVVHVVWHTDEENISDEQVQSQIDALNRDYRLKNDDRSSVPDVWTSLVTDPNIEFELAGTDPGGSATNGITRTRTDRDAFTTDDGIKRASTGGADGWPSDRYLNLWTCNLSGGLLGYAQFPGGPAETDGVVILSTAFGTTGTATAPFNLGRTATHEVGHWLDLRHIWGDRNDCKGDDRVGDTPEQEGPNYGTPDFPHVTCQNGPNGDMFMNYMDYVDDAAMVMFTSGQVARMNATLGGPRSSLAGNP
jgi:hypothetical protein